MAVFLLSSCLNVSEFADYWSKGYIDKSVLGYWDQIDPQNHFQGAWEFRDQNDGEYHFIMFDKKESREGWQGKTLDIGNYKFLMVAMDWRRPTPGGIFFRYEIKGDKFYMYSLDPKKADELIKSHRLDQKNIRVVWKPKGCCPEAGDRIEVQKLDREVVKFLADIPESEWSSGVVFVRRPTFKFNQ